VERAAIAARREEDDHVAIDGRDIARARAAAESGLPLKPQGKRDAYESPAIRLLSHALIWVPIALLVWFAYESGSWLGGWEQGVINIGVTIMTMVGIWFWRYIHKNKR
jgi:hypothetical protein